MIKRTKRWPRGQERSKGKLVRLGLTCGDPAGIGPEVLLKALACKKRLPAASYLIFGPEELIRQELKALKLRINLLTFSRWEEMSQPGFYLFSTDDGPFSIKKGEPSAEAGQISFKSFARAIEMASQGYLEAVVTAPVSKLSWSLAGLPWRGHTEYLEGIYPEAIMAFWSQKIRVALFSHHVSLKQAMEKVKKASLLDFFLRLENSVRPLVTNKVEFLVAGLNPHAGEDGLLGEEEKKEIIPAIQEAQKMGLNFSGPYPPDTIFRQALERKDCWVVALYHDQGLIAFKLMSFEKGVNVTLGLPFVRTSPDHGTAFDIATKRIASEESMLAAINLAYKMARSSGPPALHLRP
jgi:4-hydroxythreonine-4-phosphate dehydrogenase